jgi:hypothetical protein
MLAQSTLDNLKAALFFPVIRISLSEYYKRYSIPSTGKVRVLTVRFMTVRLVTGNRETDGTIFTILPNRKVAIGQK